MNYRQCPLIFMTIKLKQNNLTNFYNAEPLGALGLYNQASLLGLCPLRFINCFISKYNWASLGHEEGRVAEDENGGSGGDGGDGRTGGDGDSGRVDNPLCLPQHPSHAIKYIPDHFAPASNLQWLSTVYRIKNSTYLSRLILRCPPFSLNHCPFPPQKKAVLRYHNALLLLLLRKPCSHSHSSRSSFKCFFPMKQPPVQSSRFLHIPSHGALLISLFTIYFIPPFV